jgi:hypothetical protein
MTVIRIKELRRREERLRKVKELIGGSAMDKDRESKVFDGNVWRASLVC